ncbi:MAG: hypothetical protein ABI175_26300 [Polyangiales bacterium]
MIRTVTTYRAAGGVALIASHELSFVDALHAARRTPVDRRLTS